MYAYRPKESSRTDEIWSRRSSHRRIASGLTHYQSVYVWRRKLHTPQAQSTKYSYDHMQTL